MPGQARSAGAAEQPGDGRSAPRGALLQAIRTLKALDPRVSLNEVLAFLHVCGDEGLTVQALAEVAELTQSTASRSLRALGPAGSDWAQAPALGLVEPFLNPLDGRSHVIRLTDRGRALRGRLDSVIRDAATIADGETLRAAE